MSKEVVSKLEVSANARGSLGILRNLCSNTILHLEDINHIAKNLAKDEELFGDEEIDFFNLVDIRSEGILEMANGLLKILEGEKDD